MMLAQLYSAASLAAVVSASMGCGTPNPTPQEIENTQRLMEEFRHTSSKTFSMVNETVSVKTYFHVVHANETEEGGYITEETLENQLEVLSEQFSPHGFTFTLEEVLYHDNEDWANNDGDISQWSSIKASTRQGGYDVLNMWFTPTTGPDSGGFCTLPGENISQPMIMIDGCIVRSSSVPGGAWENHSMGMVGVHEVGHWLNLHHTFAGEGCSEPGDMVDDTPAQSSATIDGCPIGRDSCPDQEGLDPIHNHMDLSDDSCKEEFTLGQRERMQLGWSWRAAA